MNKLFFVAAIATTALNTGFAPSVSAFPSLGGTLTNTVDATLGATTEDGLDAFLGENSDTEIDNLAGLGTDSYTEVGVNDLKDLEIPDLHNLGEAIQKEGSLEGEITIGGDNLVEADVQADLGVEVEGIGGAKTCLDADGLVGNSGVNSAADCTQNQAEFPQDNDAQSVPEPTAMGGLLLLGGYFVKRRFQKAAK
ncbi:MAG: PEP-CTERM sorting domain-containing protein [Spirulinaceae cyanobacterium]